MRPSVNSCGSSVSLFSPARQPHSAMVVLFALAVGCSSGGHDAKRDTGQTSATPTSAQAPSAVPSTEGVFPTSGAASPLPVATGAPSGTDFGAEARLLAAVAACAEGTVVPPGFDQAVVGSHCRAQRAAY